MKQNPLVRPNLCDLIQRGRVIVLTGEFSRCNRVTAIEIFEALGLRVSGSVSSKTAFLLCGADPQKRKIDRASELSVPVYTEKEFWIAVDVLYPAERK